MHLHEFRLERVQGLLIEDELHLERPIRRPAAAREQLDYLVHDGKQVHHRPSTCASAASARGSQKVMSMAPYNSMAVDSSARACSRCSIFRYSVPRPRWQWAMSGR